MYMAASRAASATKKYKAACDKCHATKVKCPGGGPPCQRCADSCYSCNYSLTTRVGKPPGSRNKKTLERLRRAGQVNTEKDTGDDSIGSGLDALSSTARATILATSAVPTAHKFFSRCRR
jgi:Fungal Zn(2)-Cys(6) binuclear cluster domain